MVGLVPLLLVTASCCSAQNPLNKDHAFKSLFPEQLEQQQVQLLQSQIHNNINKLQFRLQEAADVSTRTNLLNQMQNYQVELQDLQQRQVDLQHQIQRRLAQADFDFDLSNQPFPNRLAQPVPEPQPSPQQPQPQFQPQPQPPPQRQPQPTNTAPQPQPITAAPQPQPSTPEPQPAIDSSKRQAQPPTQLTRQQVAADFNPSASQGDVCPLESGQGNCRPLIQCLSFYADVPELRRRPCDLGNQQKGVCCPPSSKNPGRGNSGVVRAPPPPRVSLPPIAAQELEAVAREAVQQLSQRSAFAQALVNQGVFTRKNTPAAAHLEFFQTSNQTLEKGDEAFKNLDASTALVDKFKLDPDQGRFGLPSLSILGTVLGDTCPQEFSCRPFKYRSSDGSCNNLDRSQWGKAGTALQRILPPNYLDGVNSPRMVGVNGRTQLPSARLVSTSFAADVDRSSENYTIMVMQWGQFLDHDLTHTPISRGEGGSGISCCRDGRTIPTSLRHPECYPIELPNGDQTFTPLGEFCMEFARSLPAPRPQCNFGPREQMNQVTGWLDGSNVYGSNDNTQRFLREGFGGRLRVQAVGRRQMLPGNPSECSDAQGQRSCFFAGDGRVNEQVELVVMHTVWMREHNRVAGWLQFLNPSWSDEAIFQEARRIVVAQIQHITYNEFLPIILGREYMDKFGLTPREEGYTQLYDSQLNGAITNVFATAAYRFGHSLIQGFLHGYGRFGNLRQNLRMSKQHFNPFILYDEGVFDDFLRGLSAQKTQSVDRFFSKEVRDHLFQGDLPVGLDLIALNIQRGRDHGLPSYVDWRRVCGLSVPTTWRDFESDMDPETIGTLARLYADPRDVDLFVGAVSEASVTGALVGPTLRCLIGDQFSRLRRGDSFFYEEANRPSSFSQFQLRELKKSNLARILCDNSDDIALMQPLAFVQPSFLNQRVDCNSESIPFVDLRAWANEPTQVP